MSRAESLCSVHQKIIAFGGAAVSRYMNEGQRNVTLWASRGSGMSKALLIVAGFYVTTVFPRNFDSLEVHKWLEYIYPIRSQMENKYVYRILRLAKDPRIHNLPDETSWPRLVWMIREDDVGQHYCQDGQRSFRPGHYMVVLVPKDINDRAESPYNNYKRYSGKLVPLLIDGRTPTAATRSGTGTGSSGSSRSSVSSGSTSSSSSQRRDQSTVTQARLRDGGCVVTKQYAKIRARGYAYEGTEVAHIYPLAFAHKFPEIFPDPSHPLYNELNIDINNMTDHNLRTALDCVKNCIVLRADLHTLFDMYQFSFKKDGNGRWYMVRFERGARPFHNNINAQMWMEGRMPTTKAPYVRGGEPEENFHALIDGPSEALLENHYRTAVSWHVAGAGIRPLDNAILVQSKINPNGPLLRR